MDDWIKSIFIAGTAAIVSSTSVIFGFSPRLNRAERDIETKLSKEVFLEVRKHIDGQFESQRQLLNNIQHLISTMRD